MYDNFKKREVKTLDDSPIPRCIFRKTILFVCIILAVFIILQINVNTYADIKDTNCFCINTCIDFENIGIAFKDGIVILPLCRYAFFALKKRMRKFEIKIINPPSCRYAKILNC